MKINHDVNDLNGPPVRVATYTYLHFDFISLIDLSPLIEMI